MSFNTRDTMWRKLSYGVIVIFQVVQNGVS